MTKTVTWEDLTDDEQTIMGPYDRDVASYATASDSLVAKGLIRADDGSYTKAGRKLLANAPPECSICRRRHGLEKIHACE